VSEPLRLGLLSTARINLPILEAAAASDRVEVVAVASRDAARAQAYAHEHGIPRAYGSYERLLDDNGVDAVYISLPNSLHHEWALQALDARKHVLCEKPYSRHPEEAEEAFDRAEKARRVLMEGFMYRHHPQTAMTKQLVDEGVVGQVQLVRSSFSFLLDDPGDVRARPELDGGALMDIGCYCVSLSRFLVGEPERVAGEQVLGQTGVDTAFHGTMRFPGDVVAQFDCSFGQPHYERLDVVGDKGWLLVESPWRKRGEGELLVRHIDHLRRIDTPEANAYVLEIDNFAAAVAHEAAPLIGPTESVGQARTIEALYRAAAEGRAVEL
jgi:predicted dehydrogenase